DFADGTSSSPGTSNPNRELLVNANIEPDADRDGFGDETQDRCPGISGSANGCPIADLQLNMTASHGAESDLVTYTLAFRNNGPDQAVTGYSDTLPPNAGLLSPTPKGGCPTGPFGPLHCLA